ncbi:MAG: recombinase family protein [Chthonomonadaceae bacterium]|nr:recombinase family protein [Chthonomonadaceae bacterium]
MKRTAVTVAGVAYARVSSKEQEAEGFSIDSQVRLLRSYAAERGIDLEQVFVEAETAKRAGRKAFGEMVRFLAQNPGRVILVEKVDRLYRNFADYVKVDSLRVELHFVKEGMVVSESSKSQDKFMHGIRVLMAKNYVDNLSEEIRKGLDEKAAQGIYPTHAPLGYLNSYEPGTRRKIIVPDPARAMLVKEIFEVYGSGGSSLEILTKHARTIGLTSKKGKPLPKSGVAQLLKHPVYCGLVRWAGKETTGIHEPLVSRELWEQCQAVMSGRKNNHSGYGVKDFAYRGLVRCKCGGVMTGEVKQGKFVYYHCAGRKKHICQQPFVKEETLTEQFAAHLSKIRLDPSDLEWLVYGMNGFEVDRNASRDKREAEITSEISSLKERLELLYLDKLSGDVSPAFYCETRQKWESLVTDLELELAALDRAESVAEWEVARVLELALDAPVRFKNNNSAQRREIVERVCSNCRWEDGELKVEFKELWDLMLNALASKRSDADPKGRQAAKTVDWWR